MEYKLQTLLQSNFFESVTFNIITSETTSNLLKAYCAIHGHLHCIYKLYLLYYTMYVCTDVYV